MAGLFDLSGRTALITGSSRGLGRAMAEGLAAAGASVVLNGVDPARLDGTAADLRGAGHEVRTAAFDVTDEAAVEACFAGLDRDGVEVDILINNAGINLRGPMAEMATADFRRVLETNLVAAFVVARAAARRMIGRRRGKVINIGSVMSGLARPTVSPYAAAKGGIKLLTQAMAAEWAEHNVQANAIGPGYMLTDMNERLVADAAFNAWVIGRTPSRRWGRPEELVGAAVFLSSAASDYVNGQIVYVDGGMTAVI